MSNSRYFRKNSIIFGIGIWPYISVQCSSFMKTTLHGVLQCSNFYQSKPIWSPQSLEKFPPSLSRNNKMEKAIFFTFSPTEKVFSWLILLINIGKLKCFLTNLGFLNGNIMFWSESKPTYFFASWPDRLVMLAAMCICMTWRMKYESVMNFCSLNNHQKLTKSDEKSCLKINGWIDG